MYTTKEERKKAMNTSNKMYRTKIRRLDVSHETFQLLEELKSSLHVKSYDLLLQTLAMLHPSTDHASQNSQSTASDEQDSDKSAEDEEHMLSKKEAMDIAVITRLIVEGGVSVVKLPLVLQLCGLLIKSGTSVISTSSADRTFHKAFALDLGMLVEFFDDIPAVHAKPDCSTRQGQERLSLFVSGWKIEGGVGRPVERCVFTSALASKSGADQFLAVRHLLVRIKLFKKLESLTSDGGLDVCAPGGLFGLLEENLGRPLIRIEGDLHVLNRGFVVAGENTWGAAKKDVASVFQLLYLVSYVLDPWKEWKPLLMEHLDLKEDESVEACPTPVNTRWYTVVFAAKFTDDYCSGLIHLGREVTICYCD